jgi:uncharacterized FAD-dependent dehydrogenase
MIREFEFYIKPEDAASQELFAKKVITHAKQQGFNIEEWRVLRKSIDARKRPVALLVRIIAAESGEALPSELRYIDYPQVENEEKVGIIGAGPAGLFAALRLIEAGKCPVIFERGKDVKSRRRDLAAITKDHVVNSDSNYCFGEGGAGTYSDGKLYTRSGKRGDIRRILEILVRFGADSTILSDGHPHIGTNKLPALIEAMRKQIVACGGKIHFNARVEDILVSEGRIAGLKLADGSVHEFEKVILATGHSARDIFELFDKKSWKIEFKPFALGVRAEHPQKLIDKLQYHCESRGDFLPPASYSLVTQVGQKGVYSFCMCPGGIIAPCATKQEEVVTNGWSPSRRNNPWANSGIVTEVGEEEVKNFSQYGELRGLRFQQHVERLCWEAAGKSQKAPAQRLLDFVQGKKSENLPDCSYYPGIVSVRLDEVLPAFVVERLCRAFVDFGKKMPGYLSNDAVIVAPESRTSSPVRIPRDKETLQHPEIIGLYPCGEGAGYAGGIISAAMDGEKVAEAISLMMNQPQR